MNPTLFDLTGPLPSGTTVLEASAGTGKTFAIAALAARYLAEGAAEVDDLLLITFSRAATAELRSRVRERIRDTAEALRAAAGGVRPLEAVAAHLADAPADEVARRLLDFLGLDWTGSVLEFHRSERGVQTPSRWQVKQPIHTRSIGRWRHYQDQLAPLLATLDPDAYPRPAAAAVASKDQASTPSA